MTDTGSLREDGAPDTAISAAPGTGRGTDSGGAAAAAEHDIGGGAAMVDLHHQGQATIIGVGVLELPDGGIALVDPGPEARLHALREGLAELGHTLDDVRAILLTHIHLDHATAAGAIVREAPGATVHVHAVGAPHMADPSRLLASAGRIYGNAMATLWGEFLPVPRESIRVVDEGDAVALGGRRFEVAYVPGHAKHHVAYHEAATGTAWVGDVGGIRIEGGPALPVTPPPDIDVEMWKSSMERVMAWGPERIVATHFGAYEDVAAHFAELTAGLDAWAAWVREGVAGSPPGEEVDRAEAFAGWVVAGLRERVAEDLVDLYATASGFPDSWWGLARYWRKRAKSGEAAQPGKIQHTGGKRSWYGSLLCTLAWLAIAGCTADIRESGDRLSRAAVRDSGRVLIAENGDSVHDVGTWMVREEPVVTIGKDHGAAPEYQFARVGDALWLPDGGILVADAGDNTLRVYGKDGVYGGTWGRRGEGPGDFSHFGGMGRLGADSVVVWDRGMRRLTVFDITGDIGRVSTAADVPELVLLGAIGTDRLVFEQVVEMVYTEAQFVATLAGRGDRRGYERQTGTVEIRDAIGDPVALVGPYAHTEHHFPTREVRYYGSVRYSRKMITGVWDQLAIAGPNDTYELRAHGTDGRLERIVRLNRPPVATDDGHRRAFAEEWTVFDPQGWIVAQVTLSDRLRVWEIGADGILVSQTNELDVESVAVLSLNKG